MLEKKKNLNYEKIGEIIIFSIDNNNKHIKPYIDGSGAKRSYSSSVMLNPHESIQQIGEKVLSSLLIKQ